MCPDRSGIGVPRLAWLVAMAVIVVLSALPVPLHAEATAGQRAYLEGVRAYEVGDYTTAVTKMREALKTDSSEALRKFRATGLKEEDYLPHFFLGLSLEKTGAREEALTELRESERQGAVRGKPGSLRLLTAALSRLAPPPTRVPEVPAATPTPTIAVPSVSSPTATAVPEPTREVVRVAPTATRVPSSVPAWPTAKATARPTATPTAVPVPAASDGEKEASLREGLRAFFRAEYRQAAVRLEPLAEVNPTARRFLAFSLAGRYILEGRRDSALLTRARAENEKAVAFGGGFPSPELIPEAIRETLGGR